MLCQEEEFWGGTRKLLDCHRNPADIHFISLMTIIIIVIIVIIIVIILIVIVIIIIIIILGTEPFYITGDHHMFKNYSEKSWKEYILHITYSEPSSLLSWAGKQAEKIFLFPSRKRAVARIVSSDHCHLFWLFSHQHLSSSSSSSSSSSMMKCNTDEYGNHFGINHVPISAFFL